MHPDISQFPSLEFYNLALLDGTVDEVGNAIAGLEPPISQHLTLQEASKTSTPSVIFLDHGGNESMKGRSRVNVTEAHLVASVVEDLLLANPVRPNSTPFLTNLSNVTLVPERKRHRSNCTICSSDPASDALSKSRPTIQNPVRICSWLPSGYATWTH